MPVRACAAPGLEKFGFGHRRFGSVIGQIRSEDARQVSPTLVTVGHGFYHRDQAFDLVGDHIGRERAHFVLYLDLQAFGDSFAKVLFARNLALGNLDLVDVLHVLEVADVEPRDQGDRHAALARAARAAGSVNVDFRRIRRRIADYVGEIADIDAPGRDVGGDQKAQLALLDFVDRRLSSGLGQITGDLIGVDVALLQIAGDVADVGLGVAKHDRTLGVFVFDDSQQGGFFVRGRADVVDVLDLLGR